MTKTIALLGPESSGKSTLCQKLASHFGCPLIPEFARDYLNARQGKYSFDSILLMATKQTELAKRALKKNPEILILDTELIYYVVWSRWEFKKIDPLLEAMVYEQSLNLTLLVRPDIPWEPDPLRIGEQFRQKLFDSYEAALKYYKQPYQIISGDGEVRFQACLEAINHLKPAG